MEIKVILLDIDGTLTNSRKIITEKTREALLRVQESGVKLVLASGRPDNGLVQFAETLDMYDHHGMFVCFNGAKAIDITTGEIIYENCMTKEQAQAVLKYLKQFDVCPLISKGNYMHVEDVFNHDITYKGSTFNVLKYESRNNNFLLCEEKNLAEYVDFPVEKILVYGDPDYLQENYQEMKKPFTDLNSMFTADFYYEFTADGVDKTKAIRHSLVKLGYHPEEMMAFGDAQNDRSMIEFAGIGIAMGNATEELKEAADEITLSNDEDGIAASLYQHFPKIFNR